jgi:phage/plasmid-associated DNA primase
MSRTAKKEGTPTKSHGLMLKDVMEKINWKIAVHGENDLRIYRQHREMYFERIFKYQCKQELREFFPWQTSAEIAGLCDSLLEDSDRMFDDGLFLQSRKRIVGFKNAVFDLLTGVVRKYQPSDFWLNPLPYNVPEQVNGDVERCFSKIVAEWVGADVAEWFLNALAYFLFIFPNKEHMWLDLFGAGRNGKSSLLSLLEEIIGDGNTMGCDLKNIGKFSGDAFKDKWLVIGHDSSEMVSEQATAFIKRLTGEKKLHVEKKGGAEYDTDNTCKLIVSTNYLIQSKDRSYGWYRRLVPVPFTNRFPMSATFDDDLLSKTPDIARVLLHRAYLISHNKTQLLHCLPSSVKGLREETRMLNDRLAAFWQLFFHRNREEVVTNAKGQRETLLLTELDDDHLRQAHGKTMSELYDIYSRWHQMEFGGAQVEPSLKTFGGPHGAFLQSDAGEYFLYRHTKTARIVELKPALRDKFLKMPTLPVQEDML